MNARAQREPSPAMQEALSLVEMAKVYARDGAMVTAANRLRRAAHLFDEIAIAKAEWAGLPPFIEAATLGALQGRMDDAQGFAALGELDDCEMALCDALDAIEDLHGMNRQSNGRAA